MRLLLGMTEAAVFPFAGGYVISLFFDSGEIATALGIQNLYAGIITIMFSPLGALFLWYGKNHGNAIMHDWQWLLVLEGIPAIVSGFLVMLYLPDSPEQCGSFLSPEEHKCLIDKMQKAQDLREGRSAALANGSQWSLLVRLIGDERILTLTACQFLYVQVRFQST